ncbi:unnamed protein product, partial [Larinioides sclopetarius]
LSADELVAQSVIFFTAGYDTTSSTLSCATYQLALNLDIQDKLREEIDRVLQETNVKQFSGYQTFDFPVFHIVCSPSTRFTTESRTKRDPYSYLPFGAGPRNCVGMRFALMQIKICLALIIASFKINKCSETKVKSPLKPN